MKDQYPKNNTFFLKTFLWSKRLQDDEIQFKIESQCKKMIKFKSNRGKYYQKMRFKSNVNLMVKRIIRR